METSKELLYYSSYDVFVYENNKEKTKQIPGYQAFSAFFLSFNKNIVISDRTGTITTPIKVKLPSFLEMPKYEKFDKSFSDVCDERAKFLLDKAKNTNRKLVVMYSGGVDSTLILCSFLKNANDNELKNIIVLLSEHSVAENPNFYNNFVFKKFTCLSGYRFPYFLGDDNYILINGENADQLFGSQVLDNFRKDISQDKIFESVEGLEGKILDYFSRNNGRKDYAEHFYTLCKNLANKAPIEIDTVYKFFWWINFTLKWQNVYIRMLPYSLNQNTLKLEENYTTFFSPKEFQLWALNNSNHLIEQDGYITKYIAKKYIIDVNGDTSYINKPKMGSLSNVVERKKNIYSIDCNVKYINQFPGEEYYNYENDFVKMK